MDSEFFFEGKKYISTRKAATLTKYAWDYVGQLCRLGKVDCRKVGKSWYVCQESILKHANLPVTEDCFDMAEAVEENREQEVGSPSPLPEGGQRVGERGGWEQVEYKAVDFSPTLPSRGLDTFPQAGKEEDKKDLVSEMGGGGSETETNPISDIWNLLREGAQVSIFAFSATRKFLTTERANNLAVFVASLVLVFGVYFANGSSFQKIVYAELSGFVGGTAEKISDAYLAVSSLTLSDVKKPISFAGKKVSEIGKEIFFSIGGGYEKTSALVSLNAKALFIASDEILKNPAGFFAGAWKSLGENSKWIARLVNDGGKNYASVYSKKAEERAEEARERAGEKGSSSSFPPARGGIEGGGSDVGNDFLPPPRRSTDTPPQAGGEESLFGAIASDMTASVALSFTSLWDGAKRYVAYLIWGEETSTSSLAENSPFIKGSGESASRGISKIPQPPLEKGDLETGKAGVKVEAPRVIVERITEKQIIVQAPPSSTLSASVPRGSALSREELEEKLNQLNNSLSAKIYTLSATPATGGSYITNVYNTVAQTNRIDKLHTVVITDSTFTGGSVSGASVSATGLSVTGTGTSTFSGGIAISSGCFRLPDGTCAGAGGGSGNVGESLLAGSLPYYEEAGSTLSATTTIVISPLGYFGIGTTSPSDTLAINGATYLAPISAPGVATDRIYNVAGNLYWNGADISSGASASWSALGADVYRLTGNVGVGTTSPYAKLSVVGETVSAYFTATTTATSTLPRLSATGISTDWFCLGGVCNSGWPSSASSTLLSDDNTFSGDNIFSNIITGSITGNAGTVTNGVYTTDTGSVTNTMLANSSLTVNGTAISLGGSGTITSASSTLLSDANIFSGVNNFTNAGSNWSGTWQSYSPSSFQTAGSYLTAYDAWTHPSYGGSATSSLLTLTGGLLSTASTTFNNEFHLPSLSNGGLAVFDGLVTSYSTSTWTFASSTLLSDTNIWTGGNTFANSTSTHSTSTNLYTSSLVASNSTSTNFYSSSLIASNATSTSLFARIFRSVSGIFSDITTGSLTTGNIVATSSATSTFAGGITSTTGLSASYADFGVGQFGVIVSTSSATSTFAGGISLTAINTTSASSTMNGLVLNGNGLRISTMNCAGLGNGGKLTTDANGNVICGNDIGGGGSVVSTVTNSDGTLTVSPTSGDVVVGLNLANANSWTGGQTFVNATSTRMFYGVQAYFSSTSIGNLTVGSINSTSTATSTFSGGISTGGLSSTNGFVLSGGVLESLGAGTSTFAGGLDVLAINQTGVATSTFANGIQLSSGCFRLPNGECAGTGGGATISASPNTLLFTADGTTIVSTSSLPLYVGAIYATSSVSSYFGGNVGVGTTSPWAQLSINPDGITGPAFAIGSSTATKFVVTNGGNVGIGTSNPGAYLLNVNGNSYLNGTTRFGNTVTVAGGYGIVSGSLVGGTSARDNLTLDSTSHATKGYILMGTSGGTNVGIGTTTPHAKLTVTGSSATTPTAAIYGFNSQTADLFLVASTTGTATSTAFIIDSNGKVGIGTTTPSQQLSVQGNGLISGALTVGGNFISNTLRLLGLGGSMLTATDDNGNIVSTSTPTVAAILATSTTATSTFAGGLSVGNNAGFVVNQIAPANSLTINSSGNVGIGTANPSSALHVSGNGYITSALGVGYTPTGHSAGTVVVTGDGGLRSGSSGATITLATGGAGTGNITIATANSGTGKNIILSPYSGGNVGIGTTSPSSKLSIDMGNGTGLGFYLAGNSNSTADLFRISTSTASATSTAFVIDSNGKVGIGTTTPSQELSVAGNGLISGALTVGGNFISNTLRLLGLGGSMLTATDENGNLVTTSTPSVASINATSTTATSTFAGGLSVGNNAGFVVNQIAPANSLNINASGNVGIGTANPGSYKLNVNGGQLFVGDHIKSTGNISAGNGSASAAGFNFYYDTDTGLFSPSDGSNILAFTNGGAESMRIDASRRLGIATTSPWAMLSINGTSTPTVPLFAVASSTGLATSTAFIIDSNGKVGIGTTTPSQQLSVQGNGLISGALTVGGNFISNTLRLLGLGGSMLTATDENGNLVTTSTPSVASIIATSTTATSTFAGGLTAGNNAGFVVNQIAPANSLTINSSGNVGIGTANPGAYKLNVSGNTYLGGSADINGIVYGSVYSGYASTQNVVMRIRNSAYNFDVQNVNTDSIFRVTHAGNVGISTTSPWAMLSVNGTSTQSSFIPLFAVATSTGTATSTAFIIDADGKVGVGTSSPSGRNALAVQGQSYFSGNVGIGKANPTVALDVVGNINSSGIITATNRFKSGDGSSDNPAYHFGSDTSVGIWRPGTDTLAFSTNGETMRLDASGRLGIASTSPWAMLSVNGTSTQSSFIPLFAVASSTGTATSTAFIIDSNGNVGVGTTSPGAGFAVQGTTLSASYNAYQTNATSTLRGGLSVGNNAGFVVNQIAPANSLNINASGNVGVGKANPTSGYMLDVNGNIIATAIRSTGGYLANDGTASSPAYYFNADNSVGMWRPGADTLAFSTNGEMMRIDPYGRIGMGTTTPAWNLQIASSTKTFLTLSDMSAGENAKHWFTSSMGGNFYIGTSSNSLTSTSTYLTINGGTGKVGIGTAAPSTLLHLSSSAVTNLLTLSDTTNFGNNLLASANSITMQRGNGSAAGFNIGTTLLSGSWGSGGGFISFSPNGTEGMRISNGGNLGLGTTSPSSKLSIDMGNGTGLGFYLAGNSNSTADLFRISTSTAVSTSTAFVIDSNGKVAIGKATASYSLDVAGSINVTGNFLINGSAAATQWTTSGSSIYYTGGLVGIGSTSPWARLSVEGTSTPTLSNLPLFVVGTSTASATSTAFIIDKNGRIGQGTTSPYAEISTAGLIAGGYYNADNANATSTFLGGFDLGDGALQYDFSSQEVSIDSLSVGAMNFEDDAGQVSWADMGVTTDSPWGTYLSYTANLQSNPILTVFAVSDGLGGIIATSTAVGIGTTTPMAMLDIFAGSTTPFTNGWTNNYDAVAITNQATSSTANVIKTGLNIQSTGEWTGASAKNIGLYVSSVTGGALNYDAIFNGSGMVGIGTSTPWANLSISATTTAQTTPLFAVSTTTSGYPTAFVIDRNGNVGVGTSTPAGRFSIGQISNSLGFYLAGSAGNTSDLFRISTSTADATFTAFLIDSNGKVGIGTTTPYLPLSVSGGAAASYFNADNAEATSTFAGDISVSGLADFTDVILGPLSFDTDAGAVDWITMPLASGIGAQSFSAKIANTDILTVYGNGNGSGGMNYYGVGIGNATPTYFLDVAGNGRFTSYVDASYFVATSSTATSTFAGALGIGTTSPWGLLSVGGGVGSGIPAFLVSTSSVSTTSTAFIIDSNGKVGIGTSSPSGTNALAVQGQSYFAGNVGIGDNNPSSKLSVIGTTTVSTLSLGASPLRDPTNGSFQGGVLLNDSTVNSYGMGLSALRNSKYDIWQQTGAVNGGGYRWYIGTTEKMTMDYLGNVGIGTTSPSTKLDVRSTNVAIGAGAASLGNFYVGTTDAAAINKGGSLALGGLYSSANQVPVAYGTIHGKKENADSGDLDGYLAFETGYNGTAPYSFERMRITSTGNVGIGTTTPYTKLELVGSAQNYANSASLALSDSFNQANSRNWLVGNAAAGNYGDLTFAVSSAANGLPTNAKMTIDRNGNLGIGTTSPFSRLSVSGDTWLDSNILRLGSTTASGLIIAHQISATSTIVTNKPYAWSLATGTDATPIITIDTTVTGGAGATTTINGGLVIDGGALTYDYSGGYVSINSLQTGPMNFDTDAGQISWIDLPVSGALYGTPESYTAHVGGTPVLSVFGYADGIGGVATTSVLIGTSTPFAKLSLWSDDVFGTAGTAFEIANTASTTLFKVMDSGTISIGTSTATTTITGYLNVAGTGDHATSTIAGNLYVYGTIRAGANTYTGDLFFANNFSITEQLPIGTTTMQALLLKNQFGSTTLAINENGYLGLGTTSPEYRLHVIGDVAAESFVNISTREAKKDISYLSESDKGNVLEKIRTLGVATYNYTNEESCSAGLNSSFPKGGAGTPAEDLNPSAEDGHSLYERENGDPTCSRRLGLIAEESPEEILSASGKGVDLYKMSTFILAGLQAEDKRITALETKMADIEAKVAALMASSHPPSVEGGLEGGGVQSVLNYLASLGARFVAGVAEFKNVISESLTVGSSATPSGITLFDEVTKQPYCFKMSGGVSTTTPGACLNSSFTKGGAGTPAEDLNPSAEDGHSLYERENGTPIITLMGNNPATIEIRSTYADLGATAFATSTPSTGSGQGEGVRYDIMVDTVGNTVDTSVAGEYTVTYTARSRDNVIATSTRSVIVINPQINADQNADSADDTASSATTTPAAPSEASSPATSIPPVSDPSSSSDPSDQSDTSDPSDIATSTPSN